LNPAPAEAAAKSEADSEKSYHLLGLPLPLLVPLGWMIISSARMLFHWQAKLAQASGDQLEETPSSMERNLLAVLLLAGAVVLYQRRERVLELIQRNLALFLLYGYMLLSVMWAEDPGLVVKRGARSFGSVMMMSILLTETNPTLMVRKLFLPFFFGTLMTSVVLIHLHPDLGVAVHERSGETYWLGVTTNKNQLGQLAVMGALYAAWALLFVRDLEWKSLHLLTLLAGLYLVAGSGSMTSVVMFAVGLGLVVLLRMVHPNLHVAAALLILGGGIGFCGLYLGSQIGLQQSIPETFTQVLNRDMTLTGRTELWADVIAEGSKRPFLGYGYGNFWTEGRLWDKYTWEPNQGHNGFIDTFVNLGLIGVVLLAAFLLTSSAYNLYVYKRNPSFGSYRMILFVLILMANFTESSLLRLNDQMWVWFTLAAVTPPGPGFVRPEEDGQHRNVELDEDDIIIRDDLNTIW
jgi:O-antigen ligase